MLRRAVSAMNDDPPGVLLPMFRTIAITCTMLTLVSSAFAHEGHGHPEHQNGILHYVVNPSHAIQGVFVAVVAVMAMLFIRRVRRSDTENKE